MPTGLAIVSLLAGACAPALDWRDMRPAGSHTSLQFPCKPASHARAVALAGATVELSLYACRAGDATYALAFADTGDAARVAPALDALVRSARDKLGPAAQASSSPIAVPGMTPSAQAAHWRLAGRTGQGRAVVEELAVFAYGTRVMQATVLAEAVDAEAAATFFASLRVSP